MVTARSERLEIELSHFTNFTVSYSKESFTCSNSWCTTEHVVTVGLFNFSDDIWWNRSDPPQVPTPKGEIQHTDVANLKGIDGCEFQGQGYLPMISAESNTNLPEQAVRRVQGGTEANKLLVSKHPWTSVPLQREQVYQ